MPRFPELAVKNLIHRALEDPEIRDYLPDLKPGQMLNSQYFYTVLNTVKPDFLMKNIRELQRIKKNMRAIRKQKVVNITNYFYDIFMNSF